MKKTFFSLWALAIFGFALSCKNDSVSPTVTVPSKLEINKPNFRPEDIGVYDNKVYVSGSGDGTIQMFDLTKNPATAQEVVSADPTNPTRFGLTIDETRKTVISIVNVNYGFDGNVSGPAKVQAHSLSNNAKVSEWTLPEKSIGNTLLAANGYYYVGDLGPLTRIIKLDPNTGKTSIKSDPKWPNGGFGLAGMIFKNNGLYVNHNGKLWYMPVDANGELGTVQEVTGLGYVFADGTAWIGDNLYYSENDAQDPANVGKIWKVTFSSPTTATAVLAPEISGNGTLNNPSGIRYVEIAGKKYLFVSESQLFNPTPTIPFKVNIFEIK